MPSTGIQSLDEIIGGNGYPEASAILVTGPPGIGKEALGYWFAQSALESDDGCLYMSRLSVREIVQDQKAFGIIPFRVSPMWFTREGGQIGLRVSDLSNIAAEVKEFLIKNRGRRTRIVTDVLSSILMLNPVEVVYNFIDHLIAEVKRYDAVLLATMEDGMHSPQVRAAMQQLFDGHLEFSFLRSGLKIYPLLRIGKMRGVSPRPDYYTFSFAKGGMLFTQADKVILGPEAARFMRERGTILDEGKADAVFADVETKIVFGFLARSFLDDYASDKLAIDQAGWRTRTTISDGTGIGRGSFYGKQGKFGTVLKELLSGGLVETRFFPGQRGRGGEVVKLRVAYDKEFVKRLVDGVNRNHGGNG